jgi:lipase chaperone LimK
MPGFRKAGGPKNIGLSIAVGTLLIVAGFKLRDGVHPSPLSKQRLAIPSTDDTSKTPADPQQLAPRTFFGTAPDGRVEASADGHSLRITPALRRYFDYALLAEGEATDAQIDLWVCHSLAAQPLHQSAQRQAQDLWQRYRRFRRAVVMLGSEPGPADHALRKVERLQNQIFGAPVVQALFGDTERQRLQAVHLLSVVADPSLPKEIKQTALRNLQQEGPYATRLFAGNSLQATELTAAANHLLTHGDRGPWEILLQRYQISAAMADKILAAVRG